MRLLEYTHTIYSIDSIAKSTPNDGDKARSGNFMRLLEYTHAIYSIDPIAESTPNDGDKTRGGNFMRLHTRTPSTRSIRSPIPRPTMATRLPSPSAC